MEPTGKGLKKILIVGEAPGEQEDSNNTQLIGRAGKLLRRKLKKLDIDLDRDCWKTNAVICRREKDKTPEDYMIKACYPNLRKTIQKYNPNVILLLGAPACKSLLWETWGDDIGRVGRWGGFVIPCRNPNAWIVPTYHPSHILKKDDKILELMFERHLELGISKRKNKPWIEIPNYKKQVEIITKPSQAVSFIRDIQDGIIAFDYETNCLKPEGEGTEIISCSICYNGKRTISYPWQGEAIEATSELLKSPIPKIAANLKFENKWTKVKLGHWVKNWYWDTVVAAHVLNNAPGITSVKFQSFVLLGQEKYNEHIEPFLKEAGKNKFNRIKQIDINDLLLYGGLDSLLEYKIAMKQIRLMKGRK